MIESPTEILEDIIIEVEDIKTNKTGYLAKE